MNLKGLIERFEPLSQKISGNLPLCPWEPVLQRLDPRTLAAYPPPMEIAVVEEEGLFKKLRFGGTHDAWFPAETKLTSELWSEYLTVFWRHRVNGHLYLNGETGIEPGDICIDCGACEGFFALQALQAGASKVICIEPNPDMAGCLERTFADEIGKGRVSIKHAALGAFRGKTAFSFDPVFPSAGKVGGEGNSSTVCIETLTAVCEEFGLSGVGFIKMDIEGAEIQTVEGALSVLRRDFPRLAITTYHRAFDFRCLEAILTDLGYQHITANGITRFGGGSYRPILLHAWK